MAFPVLWLAASAHLAYYSVKENGVTVVHNAQLREDLQPNWLVKAFYQPSINETGWNILEIESNPSQPDNVQVYEAGYIEGYVTYQEIYYYWYNNIKNLCTNKTQPCNLVDNYFTVNYDYIKSTSNIRKNEKFWYHVYLYIQQLEGMYNGYKDATKSKKEYDLNFNAFMWMNYLLETPDLMDAYKNREKNNTDHTGHCSALIKLLPGFKDIYFGHNSWFGYTSMNRILKRYTFPIHTTESSSTLIPGTQMTFPSYPGTVGSVDDFYLISSGLVTIETTNDVYNSSLYSQISPQKQVLEMVRSMVANRLAENGSDWNFYYSQENSGTYNNQWMILDLNKFRPGFQPKDGMLWIVEQMPGLIVGTDMTNHIISYGYWASYNLPFFKEIYNYSGTYDMFKKYGNQYSYEENFRAKIFRRQVGTVKDLDSMMAMMLYNHYKDDPYSICSKCDPKQLPGYSIASRRDLYPINGTVEAGYFGYALSGATDAKVSSFSLFSKGSFMLAYSGPTHDGLPPFQWSKVQTHKNHLGQPDLWDFKTYLITWLRSKSDSSGIGHPLQLSAALYIAIFFIHHFI